LGLVRLLGAKTAEEDGLAVAGDHSPFGVPHLLTSWRANHSRLCATRDVERDAQVR
jgi:hypothetical protein